MTEKGLSRRTFVKTSTLAAISVAPVVNALSQVFGASTDQTRLLIDCGFRLTNWKNLLNLEFYFINVDYQDNCIFRKRKIFSRYGQEESYMIVRLPQQHIAEQSYSVPANSTNEPPDGWKAVTMISGYSYLVFRIMFSPNETKKKIPLTVESLMDWNNTKSNNFKLVVRQNLTESLFEIQINEKDNFENKYPFGYEKLADGTYKYSYDKFPKAYGDPITALEFPWRLILSPKLPDQDRFKWNWEFSKEPKETKGRIEAELWTASLTITENPEYNKLLELRKQHHTKEEKENSDKNEIEEIIKKIELMILGSADTTIKTDEVKTLYANFKYIRNADGHFIDENGKTISNEKDFSKLEESEKAIVLQHGKILPGIDDDGNITKNQLLELYIKYKLVARTEKITFSPIGISTFFELKNSKVEETMKNSQNSIYSWKQLISLGRDEEVEIVKLILDKEFGHKWLHIFSAKRRTKKGLSYLDYREYIMPLEIEKEYKEHLNEKLKDINDSTVYSTSKFNAPFKSIKLLDTKPKRILRLADTIDYKEKLGNAFAYIPQVFDKNADKKHDFVEFQYQATDWQNQIITFRKKIQAIQVEAFDYINKKTTVYDINTELKKIEKLFSSDKIDDLEKKIQAYSTKYKSIAQSLSKIETSFFKPAEQLRRYKQLITATKFYTKISKELPVVNQELPIINEAILNYLNDLRQTLKTYRESLFAYERGIDDKIKVVEEYIKAKSSLVSIDQKAKDALNAYKLDITDSNFRQTLIELESQIDAITNENLKPVKDILKSKFSDLSFDNLVSTIEVEFEDGRKKIVDKIKSEVFDKWNDIYQAEIDLPNLIRISRQKIGYAVEDLKSKEQVLLDGVRDEVSNLETDYLVFKGELKREFESSKLDFFNQYASVPQLKQAKAYVKSLNKLVNEEIPIGFKYAKDYLDNQIDLTKLEVEKNASRVFAEVTESSREHLKGKIRQVASDMGGYLNPEIPVEYLTYLKDPKKIKDDLINQLPSEIRELKNEIQDGYNDLVFISEAAKDQWNTIKQIQPDTFFKGLDARILGSISLKDILGLDFEVPRLSELPDKIVYNFQTDKIREKDFSIVKFYGKNKGKQAALQIYLEKQIKNPNEYKSFTRLSDFTIAIRLASEDVLLILFNKLEVSSSNTQSRKTQVKIDDVSFGGPLNFLGKIAEAIKMPGTGLRVMPSVSQVEIGYAFALPSIETPAFNLANLKFDVGLRIPFPTSEMVKPITTTFSINRPEDKFLVTVGIFGGRGHFVLETTPEKIISIDSSIEFGGYFGINLGIASGHVYLFAGIRYQCSGGDIIFTGYIICGGGVTVFGFISVSVTFLLAMTYQNIGGQATLYGSASVRYSIKIGFFKKSFTLSYSKRISGAKGRPVDPNSDTTAYIEHTEEPVYYASVENTKGLRGPNPIDYQPVYKENNINDDDYNKLDDLKSFKTIYPKNSGLWEQYCNSFNF